MISGGEELISITQLYSQFLKNSVKENTLLLFTVVKIAVMEQTTFVSEEERMDGSH